MKNKYKTLIAENVKNIELGFLRIKRNLDIGSYSDTKTESYLREIIVSTPLETIERRGKNVYFSNTKFNAALTVNSQSLTVIAAKMIDRK